MCVFTGGKGKVFVTAHNDEEVEFDIDYAVIVAFATGCPSEPPLGFQPAPSLSFQTDSPYPSANTCTNTINLPMLNPPLAFDKFAYYNMTSGILNTAGFGQV